MKNTLTPVHGFRDLAQFGINGLTGEACAYSMRTLCDVNEEGKALLAEFFGMPEITLAPNWNITVGDKPAIGSIMLTGDILPKLAQFAFFRRGALAVVHMGNSIQGVFDQELLKRYDDLNDSNYSVYRNYALTSAAPMSGSRNVHAMSGRAH